MIFAGCESVFKEALGFPSELCHCK